MLTTLCCPECHSENYQLHTRYIVGSGEERHIYRCQVCDNYFSETSMTHRKGLRKPLSFIVFVIDAVNEGMSINAAARHYQIAPRTIL